MSKKPYTATQPGSGKPDLQHSLQQANRLLKARKYKKALAVCHRHLKAAPNTPDILSLAGIISEHNRQPEQAIEFFRRAIKIEPTEALFHYNLANTLKKYGNSADATTAYNAALRLAPDNQAILLNLGNLYMSSGNNVAAVKIYQRILQINPAHVDALHNLEQYYQRVLHTHPEHIGALRNLGVAFKMGGKLEDAEKCFLRANKIAPDHSETLINLGDTYNLLEKPAEAERAYRQAIGLTQDNALLHNHLGIVLESLGKLEEAIEHFKKAVNIDPNLAQAHKQLAYSKKHSHYDDDIRAMEHILASAPLDSIQKSYLNFGLGKAYENLRDYEKSFDYYLAANELKRASITYRISDTKHLFNNITRHFHKDLFEKREHCGHPDDSPIFIIGMPRSGTTLAEQILASHPDVHGAGELKYLGDVIGEYFTYQQQSQFPENIERIDCKIFKRLGQQYIERIARHSHGTAYITNKMPHNFMHIGMIKLMLPKAKIIHCTRNPIDTCLSCYTNDFRVSHNYSYNLGELGQYYCLYHKLMTHWQEIPEINIINFSYEALISDQENETKCLLDACGLDWNDACLSFHQNNRPIMTASVNQVRRSLYNKSVQRWKHYEPHLKPLIDTLKAGLPDTSWLS